MSTKTIGKIVISVVLVIAFALFAAQQKSKQPVPAPIQKLPRLVDLGAKTCIPCKMMAPILEELRSEHKGKLQVEFIDVWKNQSAGGQYGIRVIPTQIFFDPSGKELFRHVGFISKEDILAKWKELGFNLTAAQ
jgi:thioredoxin 1